MKKILLFSTILIYSLSCKKDTSIPISDEYSNLEKALKEINIECKENPNALNYFKGKLNEKELCYYDEVDYHSSYNNLLSTFITNKPSILVNMKDSTARHGYIFHTGFYNPFVANKGEHYLSIQSNFTQQDSTMENYIGKHFTTGKSLTILDKFNSGGSPYDKVEGYIIGLYIPGDGPLYCYISTSAGAQSKNSFLKVVSIKKSNVFGTTVYDIIFDLRCELYKTWRTTPELYGILEGQYVTRIEI